jgi:Zn-dependent protease with chaperone function
VIRSDSVNALAMVRHGWIAFTRGALAKLTPAEITGIARHEIAHLKESPPDVFRRQLALVQVIPAFLLGPLIREFGSVAALVIAFGGTWFLRILLSGHSRRMEHRADSAAAGGDAETYTRALEKIHELELIPAVVGERGGSHPDLYDRMMAAGARPAYPRPDPPNLLPARCARLLSFVTMLAAGVVWTTILIY